MNLPTVCSTSSSQHYTFRPVIHSILIRMALTVVTEGHESAHKRV